VLCTTSIIFDPRRPYLEMRRFRFARSLTLEAGEQSLALWVADSFARRLAGLAGPAGIPAGRGLLIPRCAAVHTWGMRCAIDIAFVEWPPAPDCAVLRLCEAVRPRLHARFAHRTARRTAAIEARAGALRALGLGAAGATVNFRSCPRAE
jgi:uncharacterized membrane protein (UPF0127 family)